MSGVNEVDYCQLKQSAELKNNNIQWLLKQNEILTVKNIDLKDINKEMEQMLIQCKDEITSYAQKIWDYEKILKEKGLL